MFRKVDARRALSTGMQYAVLLRGPDFLKGGPPIDIGGPFRFLLVGGSRDGQNEPASRSAEFIFTPYLTHRCLLRSAHRQSRNSI
jgi:hypothetical protein